MPNRLSTVLASAVFGIAMVTIGYSAQAADVDLNAIPAYKPQIEVSGGLRLYGNWMKGNMQPLVDGFKKFHPDAVVAVNFTTSSEGGIAGLYTGIADLAPMGDDAKITDMMPFYEDLKYVPTEISIATGGAETRGTLWPAVILVNKDNPLAKLTVDQLSRVFGAQRTGGWEVGTSPNDYLRYTAKYARGPELNIRTWDQLGLTGEYVHKPIQTYGYVAPGFKIYLERKLFHWSSKWNENYKEYVETQEATKDADGFKVASERMLEELSKDKFGIGWGAWLHAKDYPNLKTIALAPKDGDAAVPFSVETVRNRTYPLVRDYYIYINKVPGQPADPKVAEFIRFCLSREGQKIIADAGLYSPMPEAYIQEQLKKLE